MRQHKLKTLPPFFRRVASGQKNFEVRINDRDFQSGDIVHLEYFDPEDIQESDEDLIISGQITYVLNGGQFGIKKGYCVFGFIELSLEDVDELYKKGVSN